MPGRGSIDRLNSTVIALHYIQGLFAHTESREAGGVYIILPKAASHTYSCCALNAPIGPLVYSNSADTSPGGRDKRQGPRTTRPHPQEREQPITTAI